MLLTRQRGCLIEVSVVPALLLEPAVVLTNTSARMASRTGWQGSKEARCACRQSGIPSAALAPSPRISLPLHLVKRCATREVVHGIGDGSKQIATEVTDASRIIVDSFASGQLHCTCLSLCCMQSATQSATSPCRERNRGPRWCGQGWLPSHRSCVRRSWQGAWWCNERRSARDSRRSNGGQGDCQPADGAEESK